MAELHDQTDDDVGPIDPLLLRPIYSLGGAGAVLQIPPATIHAWSQQRGHRDPDGSCHPAEPVMTTVTATKGLSVPFIGLIEAHVLATFTAAGLPIPRLRPALPRLARELTPAHPLASRLLVTRGPRAMAADPVFAPLLEDDGDEPRFRPTVERALGRIVFHDGWPTALVLVEARPRIVLDPRVNNGRPTVAGTEVDVNKVVIQLATGVSAAQVADRTGLAVEDVLRLRD